MSQHTVYLASSSPRRRQLLHDAGISFVQHVVPVDEDALTDAYAGQLDRLGEYLARCKAEAARRDLSRRGRHGLVLASDTTVLFCGRSLPKPVDDAEARRILRGLRGREHIVATGVALALPGGGAIRSATSLTRVRMRAYSDDEIQAYIESGDPFDKAGAYSIQHAGFHPVASFSGCYLGVVGLPVCIVAALLGRGEMPPPDAVANSIANDQRCVWSPRCTPPYATVDVLETDDDERPDV